MKKSFLKKLAFAMAFATVATTMAPAAGVFAAKTPSLSAKSKTLLLGNEERDSYNFDIKNKETGSKYKWTTDDEEIATIKKNGVVTAEKIGKTVVTCTVTRPNGKKLVLEAPITVKENMDTITINNAPKEAIAVADSYNFNRDYTTVSGGKTTDITKWEVTVGKEKATIKDNGVFTATEPGEYEVVALGFQSKAKYDEYVAGKDTVTAKSDAVKITVAPSMVSVSQKTPTKFELTFDANMKDKVNKDNLVIKNSAGVKQAIIKSVSFNNEGTVATVETFISLADKEVYTLSYDKMSIDFTASYGEVAKIVITGPDKIEDNTEAKDITYKLYDANGVEVSKPAKASISISRVNDKGWVYDGKVQSFNIGEIITVKATYNTGNYDSNGNQITFDSAEYAILVVDSLAATFTNVEGWTLSDKIESKDADYNNPVHQLPLNKDGLYLNVKGKQSNGDPFCDFNYESTDPTKLLIDPANGKLITVSTGDVSVIVSTPDGKFKTVVVISILAEAKAASVSVNKESTLLSNAPLVALTDTFKLTIKDQYGKGVRGNDLKVEAFATPSGTDADKLATANGYFVERNAKDDGAEFTFHAADVPEGTYRYKLSSNGKTVIVAVTTKAPVGEAKSWRIDATDSLDLKVDKDTKNLDDKVISVKAYAYDINGVAMYPVTLKDVVIRNNDGTTYNATSEMPVYATADAFEYRLQAVSDTAMVIDKLIKTGDYTITGKTVVGGVDKNLYPAFLTVKNSLPGLKVTQENVEVKDAVENDNVLSKLAACFKIESNAGGSIEDKVVANYKSTLDATKATKGTHQVLVEKITVTENYGTYKYSRTVDINKVITVYVK